MTALEYAPGYKTRRFLNWFFLGLAYAFLYWGRYNLTTAKTALGDLMTNADFGYIFGAGTIVYAFSFLVNGPLTDKHGGRVMMLISVLGSALANGVMGLVLYLTMAKGLIPKSSLTVIYSALYATNMYFQSIGAVVIVKVNANWFHLSERGRLGGLFGAMISMGLFFAFDVSTQVLHLFGNDKPWWVFYVPCAALLCILVVEFFLLADKPTDAGYPEIDLGVAQKEDPNAKPPPVLELFKQVFSSRILVTVAFIGVCTGALRDGLMHWVPIFAKADLAKGGLALSDAQYPRLGWGLQLMIAGIIGPMTAGWARDKIFNSRCAPPAGIAYCILITCMSGMIAIFHFARQAVWFPYALGGLCFFMAISYISAQGLMTATAAMDFGGKAKATATGVIDGFVYIGTAAQAVSLGQITSNPDHWGWWPVFLLPFAIIGLILCLRIWHATAGTPAVKGATAH